MRDAQGREIDGRSARDTPVRFRAGAEDLFGIVTEPDGTVRGIGVVLLNGGAFTPSTGRNRFSVRLARRLAAAGFHVLRFDYRGVGESTGSLTGYDLNRPFTRDVVGAVAELHRRGLPRVVLVGTCFGARTALSAVDHVKGLAGLALMSLPLRDFGHGQRRASRWAWNEGLGGFVRRSLQREVLLGLFDQARRRRYLRVIRYGGKVLRRRLVPFADNGRGPALDWLSRPVLESLGRAIDRDVAILLLYGSDEYHYEEFRQARGRTLGALLTRAGDRIHVDELDGAVQGLSALWVQNAVIARILDWMESVPAVSEVSQPKTAGR